MRIIDDLEIKNIPLFAGISEKKLEVIEKKINIQEYDRDNIIFLEGSPSDAFYIVISGQVRVTKMAKSGREKILKYMGKGDFFGEMGIIEDEFRSASAVVTRRARLIIMNKAVFNNILIEYSQVAINMIRELSNRLRRADRDIENLAFYTVEGRLKRLLDLLAEQKGNIDKEKESRWISRDLTHKEMARRLGTSRETVTRIINRLADAGEIAVKENKIYLNWN